MRHRSRLVLAGLLVTLSLSAIASASASASTPQWWVNHATFNGEEKVVITSTGAVLLSGKLPGGSTIKIECKELNSENAKKVYHNREEEEEAARHPTAKIFGSFEGNAQLEFAGCKMLESTCTIPSKLETSTLPATLQDQGTSEVYDKFGSEAALVSLPITGCSLEMRTTIQGSPRCKVLEPSVEAVAKKCEFSATSGSTLKFGTEPMTLVGTVNLELSGANKGKVWTGKH